MTCTFTHEKIASGRVAPRPGDTRYPDEYINKQNRGMRSNAVLWRQLMKEGDGDQLCFLTAAVLLL